MSFQNAFNMQPFDEISTAELGLEDDILISAATTTTTTSSLSSSTLMQHHPDPRYPVPKWMRPAGPTAGSRHTPAVLLARVRDGFIPLVRRWLSRVLPPLLSLLRPRLTLRYALFTLITLWISYRVLAAQPLLASRLPGHTGPYDVGALDFEVALDTPRRVSDIRFRKGGGHGGGGYAFQVDTVLFTMYYPAAHPSRSTTPPPPPEERYYWFPKPISATAKGYARALGLDNFVVRGVMTGALWLVASGIQIPARVGAPLLPADAMGDYGDQVGDGRLPVVVFSHGMLSSRTDYTDYFGELASRGVVVAAIEHRDGSSPASPIFRGPDGPPEWRYYFGLEDLDAESYRGSSSQSSSTGEGEENDEKGLDGPALKEAQLSFREAEIEATVDVLQRLNRGDATLNNTRAPPAGSMMTKTGPNRASSTTFFQSRLDTRHMTLSGHSYGGTGVLRALRDGPSPARPFWGAVVLDPGKSSGRLNADVRVPLVVCHSSSWSKPGPSLFFGRPHFEVVRDIVDGVNGICADEEEEKEEEGKKEEGEKEKEGRVSADQKKCREKGWFLTSLGTSHPSITDAPLLEPLLLSWTTGSTMDAQQGIRQYVLLTRDFVRFQHTGERDGLLALSGSERDAVVSREYDPKHNDGMPEEWRKYWQIHVAPS